MTGSELFKFLEFKNELEGDIEKRRKQMQLGGPKEALAEINVIEEIVKKLDHLLHVINPTIAG